MRRAAALFDERFRFFLVLAPLESDVMAGRSALTDEDPAVALAVLN